MPRSSPRLFLTRHSRLLTGSALLLAFSGFAVPAAAQGNDGLYWAERRAKNTITISATRSPKLTVDVPATVTVITDEDIADQMVTDIKDLVRFEPGVSVRRAPSRFGAALGATGRAGNEGFTIRGIGGNRVLIQVDGIRSPQGFSFGAQDAGRGGYTDVGLVKAVEILRGPASALYGSDGLSGAISFVTSDPADILSNTDGDVGGFARAQFCSADEEFSESIAIAGMRGDLSAMLAYTRRDFKELENQGRIGGIGDSRTLPNPQDGHSNAVLGKLVWTPGEHRFRFTGEYLQREVSTDVLTGQGPAFLFGPTPSWIVDNLTAEDETERKRLSLDWTWENDGPLQYVHAAAYWQDGEDIQFTDEDRSEVSATPRPDRERLNTFENEVYGLTAEARSAFATGAIEHSIAFGGDISWTRQSGLRDGVVPPFGEAFPTRAFPETDFKLGGFFLGDEISFANGAVTLFPALRYDFYSLDPLDDPLLPTFTGQPQSDSRLSPKIGAVVKLAGDFRIFANYAQGFRAPTPSQVNNFFSNPAFGYTSAPNPELGPERSESWEGGLRYENDNVSISITGFKADYKDFIDQAVVGGSFTPSDPAIYQFVNIGQVEIEGAEASARYFADNGLTARFAIAYAKGDEILPGGAIAPLATIDPVNLVASLGYRDPAGRFGADLSLSHNAGKKLEDTIGACSADCFLPASSTVIDLTAFVRLSNAITLRGGLFNLTDETYSLWSDVRGLSDTSTVTDAYTRPGRNGSVSISFTF